MSPQAYVLPDLKRKSHGSWVPETVYRGARWGLAPLTLTRCSQALTAATRLLHTSFRLEKQKAHTEKFKPSRKL